MVTIHQSDRYTSIDLLTKGQKVGLFDRLPPTAVTTWACLPWHWLDFLGVVQHVKSTSVMKPYGHAAARLEVDRANFGKYVCSMSSPQVW